MYAWWIVGLWILGVGAEDAGEPKYLTAKYALPSEEALAQAGKLLEETYGKQIKAAKTPMAQTRLAQELLRLAKEDPIPAQKYVLAQKAKEVAIAGNESRLAVEAAEILADFAPSDTPISVQEAFQKGQSIWASAERLHGRQQLAARIEAAVWYLRCLEDVSPLGQKIIQNRLCSLGWTPRKYLAPTKVPELFCLKNALVQGDEIYIPSLRGEFMTNVPGNMPVEFGFEIKAPLNHIIRVSLGQFFYVFGRGMHGPDGKERGSFHYTNFQGTFQRKKLDDLWPDARWHSMRIVLTTKILSVFYDDHLVDTISVPPEALSLPIRVGFGNPKAPSEIPMCLRNIFLLYK